MKRICAAILTLTALSLFQLACSSGNQATAPANTTTQNSTAQTVAEQPANNAATPANGNTSADAKPATNTNANADPFPELVMLYSQLFTARMKNDRAKAETLLADDFKETTADGKVLNRAQVLAAISPDKKFDSYSLDDLKSNINGDTGTVTGRVTVTTAGHNETWKFNETFSKKQGRWQSVSSKITEYKKT